MKILCFREHWCAFPNTVAYFRHSSTLFLDVTMYCQFDNILLTDNSEHVIIAGHDINAFDRILFLGYPTTPPYFAIDEGELNFLKQEWDAIVSYIIFRSSKKVINFELCRPDRSLHVFHFRQVEFCREIGVEFAKLEPHGKSTEDGSPNNVLEFFVTKTDSYFHPFGYVDSHEINEFRCRLQETMWLKRIDFMSGKVAFQHSKVILHEWFTDLGRNIRCATIAPLLDRVYGVAR